MEQSIGSAEFVSLELVVSVSGLRCMHCCVPIGDSFVSGSVGVVLAIYWGIGPAIEFLIHSSSIATARRSLATLKRSAAAVSAATATVVPFLIEECVSGGPSKEKDTLVQRASYSCNAAFALELELASSEKALRPARIELSWPVTAGI